MKEKLDTIKQTRTFLLNALQDLSLEQLNYIPEGFNNNIIWNLGHLIAAQQGVCYLRNGLPARVSEDFFNAYKPGSRPEAPASQETLATIKALAFSTLDDMEKDYRDGMFATYRSWTTRYGVELTNIDEAVHFLLFHEGLHGGVIAALKKILPV